MDEQTRIQQLEEELRAMTERVSRLEAIIMPAARTIQREPEPARPVVPPPTPPPVVFNPPPVQPTQQVLQTPPPPKPETADDIEYKFGINGLLRGGAAVIVCGLLFLTAVLISRGFVTPPIQMACEVILCLAFIGVGFWRRNDGEDVGQLLIGIGTVGLYASFAAAYAFKDLISAELMIGLFFTLSLSALAYSWWQATKSFFILGLIGGFAAALMPLTRSNEVATTVLHFAVVLPWLWVAYRQDWRDQFVLLFLSSSFVCGITSLGYRDSIWGLGLPVVNAAIVLTVSTLCVRKSEDSSLPIHFGTAASATGMMIIILDRIFYDGPSDAPYFIGALSLVVLGISRLFDSKDVNRARLQGWALGIFALLGPLNLEREVSLVVYAVESLLLGIISLVRRRDTESSIGVFTLSVSAYLYLISPDLVTATFTPLSRAGETTLLGVGMAATLIHMIVFFRNAAIAGFAAFVGSTALVAMFGRLLVVYFVESSAALTYGEAAALAIGIGSVISALIGFRKEREGFLSFAVVTTGLLTAYLLGNDPLLGKEWLSVSLIFASALSLALLTPHLNKWDRSLLLLEFLLASGLFLRLAQVAGLHRAAGFDTVTILFAGVFILSLIWSLLLAKFRSQELALISWVSVAASVTLYISVARDSLPTWAHPVFGVMVLLSLGISFAKTPSNENIEPGLGWLFILGFWTVFTHLFHPYLVAEPFALSSQLATTGLWVATALCLIVLGFRFNLRYLRYGSMSIFAASVFKVFLVDLIGLDLLVRAVILMILGMGMLGGGYWYTIWRRRNTASEPKSTESA